VLDYAYVVNKCATYSNFSLWITSNSVSSKKTSYDFSRGRLRTVRMLRSVSDGRVTRDRQKEQVQNETPAGTSLLTDRITVQTLRDFLSDENKPADLGPVDLLQMVYLMLRKAEDGGIVDSQQTLARRLGCSVKTIGRSQKLLASKVEFIARVRRKGRTSELTINVENIPAEAPLRLILTEEATRLAAWYKGELKKRHRKKFQKRFTEHNMVTAQRILNDCGGDVDLAKSLVEFALDPGMYRIAAMKGLYTLFERWPRLKRSYAARHPEAPPIAPPVPSPLLDPKAVSTAPLTVKQLTRAVADKLKLRPGEQAAWEATLGKLSDAGTSLEHLEAVIKFALKVTSEETVRIEGASGFVAHFATLNELMQQSKEAV
jgi:hypothetical protein